MAIFKISRKTTLYSPCSPRIDRVPLLSTLIPTTLGSPTLPSFQLVITYLHNRLLNICFSHYTVSSRKEGLEPAFPFYAWVLPQCSAHDKNSVRVAAYMTNWILHSIWCTLDLSEYFPTPFIFWDSASFLSWLLWYSYFFLTSLTIPFLPSSLAFCFDFTWLKAIMKFCLEFTLFLFLHTFY